MPNEITKPFLVLGEGRRDQLFFEKLCENRGLNHFQFEKGAGFTRYHELLKGAWSSWTGFDKLLGLIVVGDNDPNEGKTFKLIKEQLQSVDLAAPSAPLKIATKSDSPPVVVVMMPYFGDNQTPNGALESLLLPVIEKRHPHQAKCYEAMFQCVMKAQDWKSASSKDKLKVRCILSSSCEDNPMCGVEEWFKSSSNLIPLDDSTFNALAELLRKMPDWFASTIPLWTDWKRANP
jgi:hypothetical protein